MNARRHEGKLLLHLNAIEAHLLHRILRVILENYKATPADLDAPTADVWYSTRGCRSAKMSADETRDWLAALHQVKRAHLRHLEDWAAVLAQPKPSGHRLSLELHHADVLLMALNDYRLMTAARHHVGEAEMDLRTEREVMGLPPGCRAALMEIHLLAWVIEEVLAALAEG